MDLQTVASLLEAEVVSQRANLHLVVQTGGAADLMSDVLAFLTPDSVLLTGLVNPQVVRTAEMAGVKAVVFVRGKRPPEETIRLADEIGLPLLTTRYTMFDACGRLFHAGLEGPGLVDVYSLPSRDRV